MSISFGSAVAVTGQVAQGAHPQPPSLPMTMSVWFYSNRTAGREPLFSFTCIDNDAEDVFELALSMLSNATTTNRRVEAVIYNLAAGTTRAQTATGVGAGWSTNSWVHAAGVFQTASRVAYLNGGFTGTNTTSYSNPSNISDILVNLNYDNVSLQGNGHNATGQLVSMAEAAIWDAALTTDEILALSKGVKPKTIRPESLIFYSPLVRGGSSSVPDETGNAPLTTYNLTTEYTPTYTDHTRRYG